MLLGYFIFTRKSLVKGSYTYSKVRKLEIEPGEREASIVVNKEKYMTLAVSSNLK